jgi:ribose 5-phosphate isomerase B
MRVGIATDHSRFDLQMEFVAQLRGAGHEVVDFGAHSLNPDDDCPDFVIPLAKAGAAGTVDRGIAFCGSGVGASACARTPQVRPGSSTRHALTGVTFTTVPAMDRHEAERKSSPRSSTEDDPE